MYLINYKIYGKGAAFFLHTISVLLLKRGVCMKDLDTENVSYTLVTGEISVF